MSNPHVRILCLTFFGLSLAQLAPAQSLDSRLYSEMHWRSIGPPRAGRARALSGGQKKLLEIGRALMTDPRLILLDEPIAGVNPTLANEIAAHLESLAREEGLTFLVIEHNMDMIARLCRPVIVMTDGRRLTQGTFAEVAADPRVQAAYMGERQWIS